MHLKKILVFSIALMSYGISYGQSDYVDRQLAIKTIYILQFDNKPSLITQFAYIDPAVIGKMGSFSDATVTELKSKLNVDDIVIFSLNRQVKLLTLKDVLELYNIQQPKSKWILKVDDDLISYPETLVISKNQIKEVISKNNFIHIILKDYYELKEKYKKAKIIHN